MANQREYAKRKVLVIEDSEFIRLSIARILKEIGFELIFEAVDGQTGFDACLAHQPDIIILDIRMRPVGGFEFMDMLRASDQVANKDVPVVLLSNLDEPETMLRAVKGGANAFVPKPPSIFTLRPCIDALLFGE